MESSMNNAKVDALVSFYENLSEQSLACFAQHYAEHAYFKDPFNEGHGLELIERVFSHMFTQVAEPRFKVLERVVDERGAVLVWEFFFRIRRSGPSDSQLIRGVSHLKFDAEGLVVWHRDYWDAAEELYAKWPVIGVLLRWLQRKMGS